MQGSGSAESLESAADQMKLAANQFSTAASGIQYGQFACLVEAMSRLVRWAVAVRAAEIDADRFLRSAKISAKDLSKGMPDPPPSQSIGNAAARISEVSDVNQLGEIARLLLSLPLPLPVFADVQPSINPFPLSTPKSSTDIVVAFTSFNLSGKALSHLQTIKPQTIHDLSVNVTVSEWPKNAEELVLQPLSVEPAKAYDLPTFRFLRPAGTPPHSMSQSGRLLLHYPSAFYARPLEFSYAAHFAPEVPNSKVVVRGHRQLVMRSFDPELDPQSGYVEVDKRLLQIRDDIRQQAIVSDTEIEDFFTLFVAMGGIAGQSLQDNIFPKKYPEAEFQDELKKLLRSNSRIGSQLEEHPHAAGGITDLSFRRIRLELKVECETIVTNETAAQFVQQTAQYVSGSDRRFGILAILDCSPKAEAPGLIADDITLKTVPHPGSLGMPLYVGIIIIRGNLSKPSALSRGGRARM